MLLFQESFDYVTAYTGTANPGGEGWPELLQGRWDSFSGSAGGVRPSGRTGANCLQISKGNPVNNPYARKVLPGAYNEIYVAFGFYFANGTPGSAGAALGLMSDATTPLAYLRFNEDASVSVVGAAGTQLDTPPASFSANTWHHVQVYVKTDVGTGQDIAEIRIDTDRVVVSSSTMTISDGISQLRWQDTSGNDTSFRFRIDDVFVNDTTGTRNNSWPGDLRIGTLFARADFDTEQGWAANRRHRFGTGVLALDGSGDALSAADNANLEIGAGDFTLEASVNFTSLPSGSNKAVIFNKWRPSTNERSYQLFYGGPTLNGSQLAFQISTDGTSGTVATVIAGPWTPNLNQWYHVAVERVSGVTSLYVDGKRIAADAADSNTYHDNTSFFAIGGEQNAATTVVANTSINGFVDEVRFTLGDYRYGAPFIPPSDAFPRGAIDDALWSSVVLLAGFDGGLVDESSFARTLTSRGDASRNQPDDAAPGNYKVINQRAPLDSTFIRAAYLAASGTLTVGTLPVDGETVTVDAEVYTFVDTLSSANDVLIGATIDDSLDNLAAAINGDAGEGTVYGNGTTQPGNGSAEAFVGGTLIFTADAAGVAGNSIATTTTLADGEWGEATLEGGQDIPGPSSFIMDRLPPRTTGVRALSLISRSWKSDAGPGSAQVSFVTADNSSANGADNPLATSPTYYTDNIETDPSTTSGLTTNTFAGARVRVDRTE